MNESSGARRTIRDVSHIFLSSEAPVAPQRAVGGAPGAPVVGCYLSRSVIHEQGVITQIASTISADFSPIHISTILESKTVIRPGLGYTVTSIPAGIVSSASTDDNAFRTAEKEKPHFPFYMHVFREDDCAMMERMFPALEAVIVVAEPQSKDLMEVFKLIKGVRSFNGDTSFFFRYFPDMDQARSERVLEVFNGVTQRFLAATVMFLYEMHELNQGWQAMLKRPKAEARMCQFSFTNWIDQHTLAHESLS